MTFKLFRKPEFKRQKFCNQSLTIESEYLLSDLTWATFKIRDNLPLRDKILMTNNDRIKENMNLRDKNSMLNSIVFQIGAWFTYASLMIWIISYISLGTKKIV